MDTNETTEKLIRYINGELSGEELSALKKMLEDDQTARHELENLQLAKSAIRSYGLSSQIAEVRKNMLTDNDEQRPEQTGVYPFMRNLMKYAAIFLVVLACVGLYYYNITSTEKLYTKLYSPYQLNVSRDASGAESLSNSYQAGQYAKVITYFKEQRNPLNKQLFLAAQSYQKLKDFANAIKLYTELLNRKTENAEFHDDAEYFLALCYLETGQIERAEPLFKNISKDTDHLYHDQLSSWDMYKLKIIDWKKGN
ncbi:MAG: tetratricopeptide repeat protein [Mucilaginibacter sp.]|nr:tetratricopeptide repeat protein [Mucilaginibacter sp.]